MEAWVPSKGRLALAHVIERPRQLVSQASPGFPLPLWFLSAGQSDVPCRIGAQEQGRRFGKGPRAVDMPDCLAGRAQAFAR